MFMKRFMTPRGLANHHHPSHHRPNLHHQHLLEDARFTVYEDEREVIRAYVSMRSARAINEGNGRLNEVAK